MQVNSACWCQVVSNALKDVLKWYDALANIVVKLPRAATVFRILDEGFFFFFLSFLRVNRTYVQQTHQESRISLLQLVLAIPGSAKEKLGRWSGNRFNLGTIWKLFLWFGCFRAYIFHILVLTQVNCINFFIDTSQTLCEVTSRRGSLKSQVCSPPEKPHL